MKKTAIILLLLAVFASCKTVKEIEYVPVHDTSYIVQRQYDSICVEKEHVVYRNGDTVHDVRTEYVYRNIVKMDTLYQVLEKEVPVVEEKIVEVERPLKWWQKTLAWTGAAALILLLIAITSWLAGLKRGLK